MHPAILQQLATEHRKEMIARADNWRRAHQARRAPLDQTSWTTAQCCLSRTQTEPVDGASSAVDICSAADLPCPLLHDDHARELTLPDRRHRQAP